MPHEMTQYSELQTVFDKAVKKARDMYPNETKNTTFAFIDENRDNPPITEWIVQNDPASKKDPERLKQKYNMFVHYESSFLCADDYTGNQLMGYKHNRIFFNGDEKKDMLMTFWHEVGHIVDPKTFHDARSSSFFTSIRETVQKSQSREVTADTFACLQGLKQKFLDKADIKTIIDYREREAQRVHSFDHYTAEALNHLYIHIPANVLSLTAAEIKSIAIEHAKTFPLKEKQLQQEEQRQFQKFSLKPKG